MDLILLYRMVILDIIIMIFLLSYGLYCKKYDENSDKFIPFAIICLLYSIMGLVTEITVNSTTLPAKVNDICHVFYFAFGLLFSFNYFKYILELVINSKILKPILVGAGVLCGVSIAIMLFADIDYIQGAGTRYSQGIGPTLCYALGFLFIIVSDVIIVVQKKKIENSVWYALLPITFVAVVLLVVQIIYPMFLFSESAIVLICLGAFFAIEDPVGRFKKHSELYYNYAYIDGLTGLFNRRAYIEELGKYKESVPSDMICVSMDINGLKNVNDSVGHDAGDELITEAGHLINNVFSKYGKVFRTGGDEFYAVIRTSTGKYEEALRQLEEACTTWTGKYSSSMKISVGAGIAKDSKNSSILELASIADHNMYEVKEDYYKALGVDRRGQANAYRALCNLYTKILKINITEDTYSIINMNLDEQVAEKGFSDKISEWLSGFANSGQVHEEDKDYYLEKTNMDYLRSYFCDDKTSINIEYRRKYGEEFKQVAMEMITADDYEPNNQTLYLYVKAVDK